MKVIKYEVSDYVDEDDARVKHHPGGVGNDYTLCGFTMDMDAPYDMVDGKITCWQCIQIIDECKKVKESDIDRS